MGVWRGSALVGGNSIKNFVMKNRCTDRRHSTEISFSLLLKGYFSAD